MAFLTDSLDISFTVKRKLFVTLLSAKLRQETFMSATNPDDHEKLQFGKNKQLCEAVKKTEEWTAWLHSN